jgi:hypothetical protein
VTVGWSQDDRNVVAFGRLYLNTLAPKRHVSCIPGDVGVSPCAGPFDELDEGVAA